MRKMLFYVFALMIVFSSTQFSQKPEPIEVLIRCDDIGMCHSVNMAHEELFKTGLPVSVGIMFPCPWYQEAVKILKKYPNVAVGIHLTLNAEWKNFRWGPVSGKEAVPSLVDSCGYFLPSRSAFNANNPKLNEIEKELRAQIERALATGLKIDYMDYHMSTAVDKIEYREIVEKLAKEYNIAVSRYLGEKDMDNIYSEPIESKLDSMLVHLDKIDNSVTNLLVCHVGLDDSELAAMIDMNPWGPPFMSRHRQSELNTLISEKFVVKIKERGIKLITYRDLSNRVGVKNMKRPNLTTD